MENDRKMQFFNIIKELTINKNLTIIELQSLTGLSIKNINDSNDVIKIIYFKPNNEISDNFFSNGEIKQNKKRKELDRALIILKVNSTNCFTRNDIIENYGFPRPIPPPHGQLEDKTDFLGYEDSKLNLRFEFPFEKDECLLNVIINLNP